MLYAMVYDGAYELATTSGLVAHTRCGRRRPANSRTAGRPGRRRENNPGGGTARCWDWSVPADESVVVRDGVGIPVTRRFHLRPDAETLVDGPAEFTTALPQVGGGRTRAFDPAEAGFDWTVRPRRVDHVILLRRSAGPARLTRHSELAATPELVEQVFSCGESASVRFAAVAGLMRTARCWVLTNGDLSEGVSLVRGLTRGRGDRSADPIVGRDAPRSVLGSEIVCHRRWIVVLSLPGTQIRTP